MGHRLERAANMIIIFIAINNRCSGVLSISGASSLLHLGRAAPGRTGQRENTETVAKLPQPAQPRYHARGARPDDHVITNY